MRDRDGFGGVAPLTLFRMKPATEPVYLSDEYFQMYGYILETAKELGMHVVFYDDCDFPSGTAGNQMAEKYPDDLLKYLARATGTITGPGQLVLPAPTGVLMGVVAKNTETGQRHVATAEAKLEHAALSPLAGGSAGFRQPPEEESLCEFFRVRDVDDRTLFEDRFDGKLSDHWEGIGASQAAQGGLRSPGVCRCRPKGWRCRRSSRLRPGCPSCATAAAIAFGVKNADDLVFWQFNANAKAAARTSNAADIGR